MALVIEDGTGVATAQSYVTVAEARAFALARGVALSAVDADIEPLLIKAADYLEAQRARYQGYKEFPGVQALQWPRQPVTIDCNYTLPVETIPQQLKNAQCQAVLEVFAGLDLMPSSNGLIVKKKKVDVIETEYAVGSESGTSGVPMPNFPKVDALLEPLFSACGNSFSLTSVRI